MPLTSHIIGHTLGLKCFPEDAVYAKTPDREQQ